MAPLSPALLLGQALPLPAFLLLPQRPMYLPASGTGCDTTHWFELLSQSSGTGTWNASIGTATDVCVGIVGGSLLTVGTAAAQAVQSNFIYVQSGTYTVTSNINLVNIVQLVGYHSTQGDLNGLSPNSANTPVITTATNSTVLIKTSGSGNQNTVIQNFILSDTAGTQADIIQSGTGGSFVTVDSCSINGGTRGIDGNSPQYSSITIKNTEIKNTTLEAAVINGSAVYQPMTIIDSYIHDNSLSSSGTGTVLLTLGSLWMERSIIVNTTGQSGSNGAGIKICSGCLLYLHNSIVANNHPDNITVSANANVVVENSIIYGSVTGWGIDGGPAYFSSINVGYGSNFSGNVQTVGTGINPVTITAGPFTNSGSGDYSLNSTAGGGAALKGAGFPGSMAGGTSSSTNLDIGPLQSAGSGGSTSTVQTTVQY